MTKPVSSSNPTNNIQYDPAIPAGATSADELMIWLKGRNTHMWQEIGDATKGVNARQKSLDALTEISTATDNASGLAACNKALATMDPSLPEYAKISAIRDKYQARLDVMAQSEAAGLVGPFKGLGEVMAKAQMDANPGKTGPGDFDKFQAGIKEQVDQTKSDLNQQNQQTTVMLQKTMNDAQEAMSEVSSIFKGNHDTNMAAIHNILGASHGHQLRRRGNRPPRPDGASRFTPGKHGS